MAEPPASAWTTAGLEEALAGLDLPKETPAPDPLADDWSLVAAAAVLSSFEPGALRQIDGTVPDAAALARLLERCTIVHGRGMARWRLQPDVRVAALRRLGSAAAITRALAANPQRPGDPLQEALEANVAGTAPPLSSLGTEELACTLEVARWLDGVVEGAPTPSEVRRMLDMAYLMEPFRRLAGEGFRGRVKELERMRRYVGVREPSSRIESASRMLRWGMGFHQRPPLVMWGLGGIGKSTLLARFVLEHVDAAPDERLSFAYVDFDRADVTPTEPATILLEAARQLAAQHPALHDQLLDFRRRWSRLLAKSLREHSIGSLSSATAPVALGDQFAASACISEFAELAMAAVGEREEPLLLVLDTFEEVQYQSRHFAVAIGDVLEQVQLAVPALRTVIAGRAQVDEFATEGFELPPLDDNAAGELLRANGVEDPDTVRHIVRRLGGNPLTLRLAAQVVAQDEGAADAIDEIRRRGRLKRIFEAREQAVQAQLYGRILRHLHSPDVVALAHPGLVLRRITPDVIADVLAEPCKLGVVDDQRANSIFEELRREVSLVIATPDGALEHRPDVRRAMLPLVRAEDRDVVEAIHRAAVRHYAARKGPRNRAEELFHRLALDEPAEELDARWMPGVEDYLRTAVEELPARAQTYLAARLGVGVDRSVWKHASLEEQERRVEQDARNLLRLGRTEEAWKLLGDQQERTESSPLYLLDAIVARELGDYKAAEAAIRRGLDAAHGVAPTRSELELLRLSAMLQLELEHHEEARARLEVARKAANWLHDTAQLEQIDEQLDALP